ncbi:MAG: hypothetical protein MAG431_02124 [Chloroflexi bacterium]|nr:hypothetical protein [Chloroflexota bacterium]
MLYYDQVDSTAKYAHETVSLGIHEPLCRPDWLCKQFRQLFSIEITIYE